jgi:glycosyltransferase involved in cell wall biosynthesis
VGLLLDVWNSISNESPNFKLIIGGRLWGGERFFSRIIANLLGLKKESDLIKKKLQNLIDKKKVVYFPGFLSDEDIASLILASEICIFPYERFESQSGAACKAVGMNTPVLVTNVGGLPELSIDESWVAMASSFESLSSKLKLKILDVESCKIKHNFQDRLEHMSWQSVAENTAHLYLDLLKK